MSYATDMLGNTRILGIDCATKNAKIGLADSTLREDRLTVNRAVKCIGNQDAASVLADWIKEESGPTLLAVDAPLGWPKGLRQALLHHRAGGALSVCPNSMFRRHTDEFVRNHVFVPNGIRKNPLEVGANFIARTAHAALCILNRVRTTVDSKIPLAWDKSRIEAVCAIEVYPAASLIAHGLPSGKYKKSSQTGQRRLIIKGLKTKLELPKAVTTIESSADVLDAVICALAGADFLLGRAMSPRSPDEQELAEIEGWIWVRRPISPA